MENCDLGEYTVVGGESDKNAISDAERKLNKAHKFEQDSFWNPSRKMKNSRKLFFFNQLKILIKI